MLLHGKLQGIYRELSKQRDLSPANRFPFLSLLWALSWWCFEYWGWIMGRIHDGLLPPPLDSSINHCRIVIRELEPGWGGWVGRCEGLCLPPVWSAYVAGEVESWLLFETCNRNWLWKGLETWHFHVRVMGWTSSTVDHLWCENCEQWQWQWQWQWLNQDVWASFCSNGIG